MAMVSFEPQVKDFERLIKRRACEVLGISDETFTSLQSRGLLPPGQRIGKYLYFLGRDIKRCHRLYFKQIH